METLPNAITIDRAAEPNVGISACIHPRRK
jgi:hypothetical protein